MSDWNRDQWEHDNQGLLHKWYIEKISGFKPDLNVREAVCADCGKVFYTQVDLKKYCYYWTCGRRSWHHALKRKRLAARTDKVCPVCGTKFTPKRGDAVYCSNACRQKRYRSGSLSK